MRSIITIILLFFSLSVFSQTYYDAKTIKKEYGRISAYNANNILIYQVECDDATWLKFQDGSIKIWDDKKEFTIFSTKLTMPSWASVGDSLNKWMGECVAMSSTPSNLDTTQIDTSLIIPLQINVINSTLSEIRDKLYTTSFDTSTIDTSLYQAIQLQSILDTLTNISSNLLHIYKLDTSQVDTSLVPQKDYTYLLELLASKSYDTSTIDTSLVMPSLTQSLIDSIGKLLTYYPINTLDTSNYWILDSIYQELKSVDTLCFTGEIAVSDSLLRTTVVDCNGVNALNVKICDSGDTTYTILENIRDNQQNGTQLSKIYDSNTGAVATVVQGATNSTNSNTAIVVSERPQVAQFGAVADLVTSHTTSSVIPTASTLEVIVENIGTASTTITYQGVNMPLDVKQQRVFHAIWDEARRIYSPIGTLVVNGTASATIVVIIKNPQ